VAADSQGAARNPPYHELKGYTPPEQAERKARPHRAAYLELKAHEPTEQSRQPGPEKPSPWWSNHANMPSQQSSANDMIKRHSIEHQERGMTSANGNHQTDNTRDQAAQAQRLAVARERAEAAKAAAAREQQREAQMGRERGRDGPER
jgi:hypothetical protein